MARKERHFYECSQMQDIADEIFKKYGSWFEGEEDEGEYIDIIDIWFALISGEQAKNSPDVYTDKVSKEWLQKQTKKKYCIAVWEEKWNNWTDAKQQWKIFECLLKISKIKQDISGYSFFFDVLGWNWERDSVLGIQIPELLDDNTKSVLQLPGYLDADVEDEEEIDQEEENKIKPKVKMLNLN
jgi:hypothetical protein